MLLLPWFTRWLKRSFEMFGGLKSKTGITLIHYIHSEGKKKKKVLFLWSLSPTDIFHTIGRKLRLTCYISPHYLVPPCLYSPVPQIE